jgi:hypothetical protein
LLTTNKELWPLFTLGVLLPPSSNSLLLASVGRAICISTARGAKLV